MPLYQHFACMCHGRNGRGARAQPYQLDMDGLIRVEQQIIWQPPCRSRGCHCFICKLYACGLSRTITEKPFSLQR
jgi:hypothetical protein